MSEPNPTDAETPRGNASTPNAPTPAWDAQGSDAWIATRALAGTAFVIRRVYRRSAGEPSYVFVLNGGRKFSVRIEGSTMGDQIARAGLPPVGGWYTVDETPSTKGKAGYALSLRALPSGFKEGDPVPPRPAPPTADHAESA
jgi:hypothetical protein